MSIYRETVFYLSDKYIGLLSVAEKCCHVI